jgi:arginase family enzyme
MDARRRRTLAPHGGVLDLGIDAVLDAVLDAIAPVEHVFLSVDVDVLDPAYAPGTGTPEPGGMTTRELLRALRRITCTRGLIGLEVVEVSPPYDHAELTALAAHRVVLECLSGLALKRKGSPARPENASHTGRATAATRPSRDASAER